MRKTGHGQPGLFITLLACTLILWGCSGGQTKQQEPTQPELTEQETQTPGDEPLSLPASLYSEQFAEAEILLASYSWMDASVILGELEQQPLSPEDQVYISYLRARILFIQGDTQQAQERVKRLTETYRGNLGLRYRGLSLQHHMLDLQGDTLGAAGTAHTIVQLLQADQALPWQRALWRNLERSSPEQLQLAREIAIDPTWAAWLQLALLSRQDTLLLGNELQRWQQNNPAHPASKALPGGLDYLLQPIPTARRVALLLPLSGRLAPAGRAVLDGFLAAHYEQSIQGTTPELLVLDTTTFATASEAYSEAILRGAELVVGPLRKEAVADLTRRLDRPIPILSLNRVEQAPAIGGSALVQMSLAPEDEAVRVAEIAFGQGARTALIVRAAGDWGQKVEAALSDRWTRLGGTLAATAAFSTQETYSPSLKDALDLSASDQRATGMRNYFGSKLEFTPRRRADIDVIFLLTRNGAQARSIKPLLAFHYAGDLPVYAISSSYSGVADARDRDLDGLQMMETPWLLGSNPTLRIAIAAGDTDSGRYTRFNALGVDAFLLQSQFSRLQGGPNALLRGDTGLLSMNPQLHILRESSLATFDGGVLTPK